MDARTTSGTTTRTDHAAGGHPAGSAGHRHHDGHPADHGSSSGGHAGHAERYRRLFWLSLALATPVVALSPTVADLVGLAVPATGWSTWVPPVLGTVVYAVGGRPFLAGSVEELRARRPGMMLLVSLAISVALVASLGASLGLLPHHLDFWWELVLLVVVMLLGHWVEMRSLTRTGSALDSLAALLPDVAERVEDGTVVRVPPSDLSEGDVVIVRPGGTVPADGLVLDGSASMDESMVTGESRAVLRGAGDTVVAGTVATDSGLRLEVTATGEATTLGGIRRLVADAQASTSRAQRLADRAAGWLFWWALGAGALTAAVWALLGEPEQAVVRTVTVLVIACPHALGLAIPLVVSIATERAARGGVLVADRLALERMRLVDTVLMDKTGTLTRGEPVVTEVLPTAGDRAGTVLALAAAAESDSEHPLARAVLTAAGRRGLDVPAATGFASSPAVGVTATVEGATVRVGGPRMMTELGLPGPEVAERWHRDGATVLHVVRDGVLVGLLRVSDEVRPESRDAVAALRALGIEVVMVTGDAPAVAGVVAREIGIDRVLAGVRPEDKAATVAALQTEGRRVAFVGDGVNDAPALARADVGLAIGAGTDVAVASAGVVLAGSDPRSVVSVLELSRASYRRMTQNLWWAAGYNLAAVPLAAGVLAPVGLALPMSAGALLMSASTVVVALNAQLLRRLDLRPASSVSRVLGRRPRAVRR